MTRPRGMNALVAGLVFGAVIVAPGDDVVSAQEASTTVTPAALAEIAQVEAEIDRIEAQALERSPVLAFGLPVPSLGWPGPGQGAKDEVGFCGLRLSMLSRVVFYPSPLMTRPCQASHDLVRP
jgi:hypothetical protein